MKDPEVERGRPSLEGSATEELIIGGATDSAAGAGPETGLTVR